MHKGAKRYQKVVGHNRAGQGMSGFIRQLLPKTYFWKFVFALNRNSLPWILGRGRKSGSAYALVDLVSSDVPVLQFPVFGRSRSSTFRSLSGPVFFASGFGLFSVFLRTINYWKNDAQGIILSNPRNHHIFINDFFMHLHCSTISDHKVEQCMWPK